MNGQHLRDSSLEIEEKIEIGRVRIFCAEYKKSGSVADIRSADRMLGAWSKEADAHLECRFQIHFEDGFSIEGELVVRPTDRNMLLGHVRRGIREILSQQPVQQKTRVKRSEHFHSGISRERLMRYRLGGCDDG